jgi:hypothetical protein
LLYIPVHLAHSLLYLNRADFSVLFAQSENSFSESVSVRSGHSILPDVRIVAADSDRLELTPGDAVKLKVEPETITIERSVDFLKAKIDLDYRGREIPFQGKLLLIPRRLFLNSKDSQHLKFEKGQTVFVAANTKRSTIFGDVRICDTNGTSCFSISREEAEGALLKENDLVYAVGQTGSSGPVSQDQLSARLPERFLQMDLTLRGRTAFILITEKHVWQAIRAKKKIWVPKNARLTAAARDLGNSRKLLEFEL